MLKSSIKLSRLFQIDELCRVLIRGLYLFDTLVIWDFFWCMMARSVGKVVGEDDHLQSREYGIERAESIPYSVLWLVEIVSDRVLEVNRNHL